MHIKKWLIIGFLGWLLTSQNKALAKSQDVYLIIPDNIAEELNKLELVPKQVSSMLLVSDILPEQEPLDDLALATDIYPGTFSHIIAYSEQINTEMHLFERLNEIHLRGHFNRKILRDAGITTSSIRK